MKIRKAKSPLMLWKQLGYAMFKPGMNTVRYDIQAACNWEHFYLSFPDAGYKREGTKYKRLTKTYLNPKEVDKFNRKRMEVIKKKKDFVLLFRFGNEEKNTSKAGDFCLVASTFIFVKGKLKKVHVYYRTTEVVTKFLADLIFLEDIFSGVLFLDMDGVEVKFFFTKVYVKYFHLLNFSRICKKLFNEDVTIKIKWGAALIKKVKEGFLPKYKAGERIAIRFKEDL